MNKQQWSVCGTCQSHGRIMRGPSKRLTRKYYRESEYFKNNLKNAVKPTKPMQHLDLCPKCGGTGLLASDKVTRVDKTLPHIAIIGAGIGGTALAVACLHRGIPFTIFERDESFNARSQGYGLTLQQASKAVAGLGITDLEEGIISTRHVVFNAIGEIIGEWGLRKWLGDTVLENSKRKNIHIARQSLRKKLLQQLGTNDAVYWNHKCIDICNIKGSSDSNSDQGYELSFKVNEQIKKYHADLVIGADGIRSSVRNIILPDSDYGLHYLDHFVMLGICSLDALGNIDTDLLDSKTVFQAVNGQDRIYMMPFDHQHIMWQLSFPMEESEAIQLHKKGPKNMKELALEKLKKWHTPITEILQSTKESDITGYPVYDRDPFDNDLLGYCGALSLIGDALHPMSPFKGQGANQAILDALGLARDIYSSCKNNSNWREIGLRTLVLDNFEKTTSKRTKKKVLDSKAAVRLLHSDVVLRKGDEPRGRGLISNN